MELFEFHMLYFNMSFRLHGELIELFRNVENNIQNNILYIYSTHSPIQYLCIIYSNFKIEVFHIFLFFR